MRYEKNLGPSAVAFPTPVYIVGTYGKDDEPTAMNVAWGGLCSSEPPCVMIAIRKERYTYENIMERKEFTVNFPDAAHVKEADYLGLVSGKKAKKFEVAGLTAKKGEKVNAPVIEEFPMALECKVKSFEDGILIGEIMNVNADESILTNGQIDPKKLKPITYDPVNHAYIGLGEKVGNAFKDGLKLK